MAICKEDVSQKGCWECKVVHLTSVHHPFNPRVFHKECKTLASKGFEVVLVVPYDRDEIVEGVRFHALPKPNGRGERITKTLRLLYRAAISENAQIYHLHDPELLPVGLLLRLQGKKVISDVHEIVSKQILTKSWIPPALRHVASICWAGLEKLAWSFSGIIAATPAIAARFPAPKTVVVQNFPRLGELVQTDPVPYAQRPMNVIYFGTISELRGAREIAKAMSALPEHLESRLVLAGRFSSQDLADYIILDQDQVEVNFLGWLDRAGLRSMLGEARVGLVLFHPVPNHLEAQPNKLFEYMSAGIPIVASDFPLWRQMIEGIGCGLLVDPLDPQAIAGAIQWLLENPEEAEAMGQRGQEAVHTKYNWKREADKLLRFYDRLLKQ